MTSPSGFVLPSAISRRTRSIARCIRPPVRESRAISSSHSSTWPSSKSASQARSSSRSLSGRDFICSAICSTRVVITALSHRRPSHGNAKNHRRIAAVWRTRAISGSRPRDYPHRPTLSRVRCIALFASRLLPTSHLQAQEPHPSDHRRHPLEDQESPPIELPVDSESEKPVEIFLDQHALEPIAQMTNRQQEKHFHRNHARRPNWDQP
jgi:hypothetical protein